MRLLRIAIVALVAAAFVVTPAPAQLGDGGCPYRCDFGTANDGSPYAYCWNQFSGGEYLTCRIVQWCYRLYGGGMWCDGPTCDGTICMYV